MLAHLWFFYALGAAMFWGIGYVISEKLLRSSFEPAFLMLFAGLVTLPCYFLLAYFMGNIKPGIESIIADKTNLFYLLVASVTIIGGNFLILMAVAEKNATLAALVEISYPLFTFIFAWLILKDVQLTWATAAGAVLILCGISVIIAKS